MQMDKWSIVASIFALVVRRKYILVVGFKSSSGLKQFFNYVNQKF